MKKTANFFKGVISFIKDLPRRWKSKTPKVAKWVRNTFTTLGASVIAFNTAVVSLGAKTPDWYQDNLWFFVGGCAAIVILAGAQEVKPPN